MKANELMIGDWVLTKDGNNQVDEIHEYGIHPLWSMGEVYGYKYRFDDIKPIPITSEILLNNGFIIHNDNSYNSLYLYLVDRVQMNHIIIYIGKSGDGISLSYYENDDSLIVDCLSMNYVHELQHLLKLLHLNKEIIL